MKNEFGLLRVIALMVSCLGICPTAPSKYIRGNQNRFEQNPDTPILIFSPKSISVSTFASFNWRSGLALLSDLSRSDGSVKMEGTEGAVIEDASSSLYRF